MRVPVLLALVLLQATCTVNADYAGVGFACSEVEACQSGLRCVAGTCQVSAGIDAGTDATEADAAIVECIPTIALSDEFSGALDAQWTVLLDNGTTAEVVDGVLVLSPAVAIPPRFARVRSAAFAMDGRRVFAEFPLMVNTDTMSVGEFLLVNSAGDAFFLRQSQGILQFGTIIDGATRIVKASSFAPSSQRWWQMRMVAGQVLADYSADGEQWTNLAVVEADTIVGDLMVEFAAGTPNRINDPGQMQIDNVNSGTGLCQ